MSERAGFAAKRDRVLAGLEKARAAEAAPAGPLDRFKKLLAIEAEFQSQLVDLMRARLKTETDRQSRAGLTYLLADTLRRLNRDAEAVAEYRAARRLMNEPSETRVFTDHFLSMLAPGEPLPVPEPEKPEEPRETAPGPEKGATPAPDAPKNEPSVEPKKTEPAAK